MATQHSKNVRFVQPVVIAEWAAPPSLNQRLRAYWPNGIRLAFGPLG